MMEVQLFLNQAKTGDANENTRRVLWFKNVLVRQART